MSAAKSPVSKLRSPQARSPAKKPPLPRSNLASPTTSQRSGRSGRGGAGGAAASQPAAKRPRRGLPTTAMEDLEIARLQRMAAVDGAHSGVLSTDQRSLPWLLLMPYDTVAADGGLMTHNVYACVFGG